MTIFLLLFSVGFVALLAVLLHIKKIPPLIFSALMALLVVFDFALLSLDKIYFLHKSQDDFYIEQLRAYDRSIGEQQAVFKKLLGIQLDATVELLAQSSQQENEKTIEARLNWRDELVNSLAAIGYSEADVKSVRDKINLTVHKYLMEQLNSQLISTLGHRIYSEFVRSKPRDEWTDELFVSELEVFLNKQNIMKPNLKHAISRIKEFNHSGILIGEKPVNPV